jgi:hypothetical protein
MAGRWQDPPFSVQESGVAEDRWKRVSTCSVNQCGHKWQIKLRADMAYINRADSTSFAIALLGLIDRTNIVPGYCK